MVVADLVEGVAAVSDAIVACGILPLLETLGKQGWLGRPTPGALIASYACFAADYVGFGSDERLVLSALDIAAIADADWWTRAALRVVMPDPSPTVLDDMARMFGKLRFAADMLPNLAPRLGQPSIEPGSAVVTVLLPAWNGAQSHPLRVPYAIEAICRLWALVCAPHADAGRLTMLRCNVGVSSEMIFAGRSAHISALQTLLAVVCNHISIARHHGRGGRAVEVPRQLPMLHHGGDANRAEMNYLSLKTAVSLFQEAGAWVSSRESPHGLIATSHHSGQEYVLEEPWSLPDDPWRRSEHGLNSRKSGDKQPSGLNRATSCVGGGHRPI